MTSPAIRDESDSLPPPPVRMPLVGYLPRALGVLFLAAAGLKIQGLGVAPVSAIGLLSTAWFQVGLILTELLLGFWLLAGVMPVGSWLSAFAAFTIFAGFSLYQSWIGQSSCGCFGKLSVSPWLAFGLDLAVLAALLLGRPDFSGPLRLSRSEWSRIVSVGALAFAGVALLAGILGGIASLQFGSLAAAIAYFRGESLSVEPAIVDIGSGPAGESRAVWVTLTNRTDQPIQVFGGTANCSCTVLADLAVEIGPQESRSLSVQAHLKGSPGAFTRKAAFLISDGSFKRLKFSITGQITRGP